MGAKTTPPWDWVQVTLISSMEKQAITFSVNWALPKMVTRSYGALPTLCRHVSLQSRLYSHSSQADSRWILEGVLELEGEIGRVPEVLHVPSHGRVAARLVDGLGVAIRAVRPAGCAVCRGVGERIWVEDGESHGDVAFLDAVNDEVGDLEGIARELLVLELQLPRQGEGSGGDEGDANGDGVDELHGSGLVGV